MSDFENQLSADWPPGNWCDVRTLVAVSGGADSVALLRGLLAIRAEGEGGLAVAHFNHGWRGNESRHDQQFVEQLADAWQLPYFTATATGEGRSEDAGRQQRYTFLTETAEKWGARYVATGHTADDQAETVLHRIIRGTALAGLAGIPRVRTLSPAVSVIRPLLNFRRDAIREYLDVLRQSFCHDASNANQDYTRNRLRHDLIPTLASDYNPHVVEALLRLAAVAEQAQEYLDHSLEPWETRAVHSDGGRGEVIVDCDQLAEACPYIRCALFARIWREQQWPRQAMGRDQWEQLSNLVDGPAITIMLPGSVHASWANGKLVLRHVT